MKLSTFIRLLVTGKLPEHIRGLESKLKDRELSLSRVNRYVSRLESVLSKMLCEGTMPRFRAEEARSALDSRPD